MAEAEPDAAVQEPAAAAPADVDEAAGGEEDDNEVNEASGAKKSKHKKKRQAAAKAAAEAAEARAAEAAAAALQSASLASKYVPAAGGTDEEFDAWLEEVKRARAPAIALNEEQAARLPKKFIGYSFSGVLRPYFVHVRAPPPPGVDPPDYALHEQGVSISEKQKSRDAKDIPELSGEDLETMRESCRLGREILDLAARALKPGVTGDFLDRVVYHACCERQIYPSPLNYYNFPKSVCVSPNEVICHGIPDMRPIEDGDIVNLDVSIFHKGFHSDLNETFLVGDVPEPRQKTVHAAYDCLHAASQMIKPGTMYRDVGTVISATAAKHGCSVVNAYTGHGVGKLFHGPPNIPHYKKNKAMGIMKPGHVFTIEPMINLGPDGGDRLWPDKWTAVTCNGKPSAQFEHTFLVTETGFEVLTARRGAPIDAMPPYDPNQLRR